MSMNIIINLCVSKLNEITEYSFQRKRLTVVIKKIDRRATIKLISNRKCCYAVGKSPLYEP